MKRIYNSLPDPPCKDCPMRHTGCHAECEKYQEYAKMMEQARKDRDKIRQISEEAYFARKRRK